MKIAAVLVLIIALAACSADDDKSTVELSDEAREIVEENPEITAEAGNPYEWPDGTHPAVVVANTPWGKVPCIWVTHGIEGEAGGLDCDWSVVDYGEDEQP